MSGGPHTNSPRFLHKRKEKNEFSNKRNESQETFLKLVSPVGGTWEKKGDKSPWDSRMRKDNTQRSDKRNEGTLQQHRKTLSKRRAIATSFIVVRMVVATLASLGRRRRRRRRFTLVAKGSNERCAGYISFFFFFISRMCIRTNPRPSARTSCLRIFLSLPSEPTLGEDFHSQRLVNTFTVLCHGRLQRLTRKSLFYARLFITMGEQCFPWNETLLRPRKF